MKIIGWALVVCGVVGAAVGQAPVGGKRAMTFADLMGMKRVSDPQVSASGRWVLFSVTEVDLEKNTKVNHLWVVPLWGGGSTTAGPSTAVGAKGAPASAQDDNLRGGAGGRDGEGKERQLTFGQGETFGRFSPDGKWVSYSEGGRIVLAPWDEGAGRAGLVRVLVASVAGGADGAVWSPDSKRLMFVGEVWPECSVKGGEAGPYAALRDDKQKSGQRQEQGQGQEAGPYAALRDDKQKSGQRQEQVQVQRQNAGVLRFAQNDTGLVVGGTKASMEIPGVARNDGSLGNARNDGLTGMEAASWGEEDGCDRARDEAAEASPVKGQVWDHLLYRHWDQYTGEKRSHVLVVNVDGSGVRDLTPAGVVGDAEVPTFSLGGPLGYAWAPDSREVAYVANLDAVPAASTNNDVFTLRLDEVGAKAVRVSTSLGSDDGPAYSPDGRWLAWRSQERAGFESDRFRLMVFDREKGTIKDVAPNFPGWVDEFIWPDWAPYLEFTSSFHGEERIYGVGIGSPVTLLQKGGTYDSILRIPVKGGPVTFAIAVKMTASRPAEIVRLAYSDSGSRGIDEQGRIVRDEFGIEETNFTTETPVTAMNSSLLQQLNLSPMESFWFVGAEGTRVQGFLLRPPGFVEGKKYPVKFVMHGGPQTALGDSWSYRWNWELMAASGYVVVGINRRGSTGYGQKFVDEVSGDWGGRAYEDLMKGLDYAEGHFPFIDKTRECALGASYGGFMADWVLTHTDRFQCIVTHDGMVDPVGAYGSTEELWFNEWEFRRPEDFPKGWDGFLGGYDPVGGKAGSSAALRNDKQKSGQGQRQQQEQGRNAGVLRFAQNDTSSGGHVATPWRYAGLRAEEDPFRRWSPMRFIEKAKTPTLVIHSQKDYRLDVSQGLELFTALQRLGVPSKMLYFPDEGHWVLKPQNSELWYEEVGDWCDKWTHSGRYAER